MSSMEKRPKTPGHAGVLGLSRPTFGFKESESNVPPLKHASESDSNFSTLKLLTSSVMPGFPQRRSHVLRTPRSLSSESPARKRPDASARIPAVSNLDTAVMGRQACLNQGIHDSLMLHQSTQRRQTPRNSATVASAEGRATEMVEAQDFNKPKDTKECERQLLVSVQVRIPSVLLTQPNADTKGKRTTRHAPATSSRQSVAVSASAAGTSQDGEGLGGYGPPGMRHDARTHVTDGGIEQEHRMSPLLPTAKTGDYKDREFLTALRPNGASDSTGCSSRREVELAKSRGTRTVRFGRSGIQNKGVHDRGRLRSEQCLCFRPMGIVPGELLVPERGLSLQVALGCVYAGVGGGSLGRPHTGGGGATRAAPQQADPAPTVTSISPPQLLRPRTCTSAPLRPRTAARLEETQEVWGGGGGRRKVALGLGGAGDSMLVYFHQEEGHADLLRAWAHDRLLALSYTHLQHPQHPASRREQAARAEEEAPLTALVSKHEAPHLLAPAPSARGVRASSSSSNNNNNSRASSSPVLCASAKLLFKRARPPSLSAKRLLAQSLFAAQQQHGFTLQVIFRAWVAVKRQERKASQKMTQFKGTTSDAIALLRLRLRHIFDNDMVAAFIFFDVNSSGEVSPKEFSRGLYRLNLHEIWRCPLSHECNKYDCAYDHSSFAQSLSMRRTSTSSSISSSSSSSNRALLIRKPLMRESLDNLHSYVVMDEARITECFKLIDTAGTSAGLDIKEFLTLMMDASLAKDSTDDDYRLNARRRHHIITTGRRWGVAEDWRRHARAKGLFAKRELYASLKTLDHLAAERERAYHCLKEFQRAVADNESELSNREQAEERLKMVGELQASMQAWKKADDGIYWSLNDGCAFLVLAKPLLEYFGLDLPRLNHKCNNVDACVEATLAAVRGLSDEQRQELLLHDYRSPEERGAASRGAASRGVVMPAPLSYIDTRRPDELGAVGELASGGAATSGYDSPVTGWNEDKTPKASSPLAASTRPCLTSPVAACQTSLDWHFEFIEMQQEPETRHEQGCAAIARVATGSGGVEGGWRDGMDGCLTGSQSLQRLHASQQAQPSHPAPPSRPPSSPAQITMLGRVEAEGVGEGKVGESAREHLAGPQPLNKRDTAAREQTGEVVKAGAGTDGDMRTLCRDMLMRARSGGGGVLKALGSRLPAHYDQLSDTDKQDFSGMLASMLRRHAPAPEVAPCRAWEDKALEAYKNVRNHAST